MGDEGSFPLVAVLDLYVIVPPSNVKLGEDFGIPQFVYEIGDEGEGVGVTNGVFIDIAVVLAGAESAVFLFDKKKGGGLW